MRSLATEAPGSGPKTLVGAGFRVDDGDSVMVQLRTPDGRIVQVTLSRREFAQLIAAGALRASLPAGVVDLDQAERVSKVLEQPRRIDPEVVDYFRALLVEHFTADKMLGPRELLGPVHAQIDVLEGLRRHAGPGTAEPLLGLLAQYAEFAGWLHQDRGDTSTAMYWSDRASQWAQAVGDYQMVAYLLVRKSNIALLDDDAVSVIEFAAAARKVPGPISPKLVALASQQQARGWALHGDVDRFRTDLDTAAELLSRFPDDVDDTAPVYLHHYGLDMLDEQSASCYRVCGQAETAVAILERKIAQTPAHLHRDRGHQLVKLANTVLVTSQPDPDRAASLGLQCVQTARGTGSARIGKELDVLDAALTRRWPGATRHPSTARGACRLTMPYLYAFCVQRRRWLGTTGSRRTGGSWSRACARSSIGQYMSPTWGALNVMSSIDLTLQAEQSTPAPVASSTTPAAVDTEGGNMRDTFERMDRWLALHAPATASSANPGADQDKLDATERVLGFGLLPEVRDLYMWHDGAAEPGPPTWITAHFRLLNLDELVERWRTCDEDAVDSWGVDYDPEEADWNRHWVPIAAATNGDLLVVDHSPGSHQGMVLMSGNDGPMANDPQWPNLRAVLSELLDTLESGATLYGLRFSLDKGEIEWL